MEASTSADRAMALARQALLEMRARRIPPTPENYLVWYTAAADSEPTLSRTLAVLDEQKVAYDDIRNADIHERFFGRDREHDHLRNVGTRVERHLGAIGELLGQIAHGTRSYGCSLADAVEVLPRDTGYEDVNRALSTLRADTQSILDRTDQWGELANSHAAEVSKLKSDLDAARREAETDALTEVGNRKRFDRRLRQCAAAACESGAPLSLVLFDIDHFKSFNDTYGHSLGDRVLKHVASRARQVLGAEPELFRYGGEEFAVLAPGAIIGQAVEVAEAVRKAVAAMRVARKTDSEPLRRITVSLGVSQYEPGEPLPRLVERADSALYTAKNSGRNCTSIKRLKQAA